MWAVLVKPNSLTGIGISSKDSSSKLVVSGPCLGVPRTRICSAVIDEIQLRIVGDPSPDTCTAYLPGVRRPTLHAEVLPPVLRIEGLEARADQDIFIRAGS